MDYGQLRVPCFEPGCHKVLPQKLVLTFSDSANVLALAIDAEQNQQLHEAQGCPRCGRFGLPIVNGPCGHLACGDCWVDWSAAQLSRCRTERCLNLACCHPDCRNEADRDILRTLSLWSPVAQTYLDYFDEVDAQLAELQVARIARNARLAEAGPLCPVCCEHRVGLLCGQPECEDHGACVDCWVKWAGEQLEQCVQQRAPAMRCIFPQCQRIGDEALWRLICARSLPAAELEQRFARRRRLQASPLFPAELQIDCPQPGCVGLGYLGYDTSMCFMCEYQWVPGEGAGKAPETDIEMVMGVAVKKCPKCGEYIEKNGGCDHMTCRCRHEFYWSTLRPYGR